MGNGPFYTPGRPEDKNSAQTAEHFPEGATLADLEAFFAHARALGAPDDAHPHVSRSESGEIVFAVCLTRRQEPLQGASGTATPPRSRYSA